VRPLILFIGILGMIAILAVTTTVAYALYDASKATSTALASITAKHLRTEVSIVETPVSFKSGATQIIGLRIQNPPGFSTSTAIHSPEIRVAIDVSRSTNDLIYAKKIHIQRPQVLLEIIEGQNNLTRLMQALAAAIDTTTNDQNIRLIVEEVIVEEGELSVVIDQLGEAAIRVPLPDSLLKNIGIEDEGAAPQLVLQSLTAFIIKITERATRRIDITAIANERGVPTPVLDFRMLLAP